MQHKEKQSITKTVSSSRDLYPVVGTATIYNATPLMSVRSMRATLAVGSGISDPFRPSIRFFSTALSRPLPTPTSVPGLLTKRSNRSEIGGRHPFGMSNAWASSRSSPSSSAPLTIHGPRKSTARSITAALEVLDDVDAVRPWVTMTATTRQNRTGWSGGNHRVVLMRSRNHRQDLVVRAILSVVPGVDEQHAKFCFWKSERDGEACVCTCLKEHAEFRAQRMEEMGCRVQIRPDSQLA